MAGALLSEVVPLPAASAILLRDDPFEVLMLQRPASASFMPNAWVFPGGMTEPLDRQLATSELDAMKVTAVRETFEETGVWLGAPLQDAAGRREQMLTGATTMDALAGEAALDLDALVYTARWITPVGVPKRFDTWFFVTQVSRDVVATAELREAVEVRWIAPAEALARHAAKEMQMVFPTLRSLEAIALFSSAQTLIDSRRGATIEPVMPVLVNGRPTLL